MIRYMPNGSTINWPTIIYRPPSAPLIDPSKLDTDDPKAGDVLGSLKRYEGSFTGSDVLYVELTEPITASWLQWALIEAGEPANIHKL